MLKLWTRSISWKSAEHFCSSVFFPLSNPVHLPCLHFLIRFFHYFLFLTSSSCHSVSPSVIPHPSLSFSNHTTPVSLCSLSLPLLSSVLLIYPPWTHLGLQLPFTLQMLIIFLLNIFLPVSVPQFVFFKVIFNSISVEVSVFPFIFALQQTLCAFQTTTTSIQFNST